ncbi:hypothetical protein C8Q72DRAFT_777911, partial [Fomitopsis betulina]
MLAWREEINGRIVSITDSLDDFLRVYVPGSSDPSTPTTARPFTVPAGQLERTMYDPLCHGLRELVSDFPPEKRPSFHNNAHEPIPFPFEKHEHEFHYTKPDIVASLPGQTFTEKFPDRWRNISTVFEVKSTVNGDPMEYQSPANDETLVQLAKSARNILFAQSRLYVFVVGIYGHFARIYRFDHAGAICSNRFNYQKDPGLLQRFLWRLAHPIHENCDILGADPTVRLTVKADHTGIEAALRTAGVTYTKDTWKTCRWVTVDGAGEGAKLRYLLYDLIFLNPGLFSRGTTVWAGLEVDDEGHPVFIVKDAWQQLARRPETEHYEQLYASISLRVLKSARATDARDNQVEGEAIAKAWDEAWTGLAEFVAGDDLGAGEMQKNVEDRVGQQTSTAVYQEIKHQFLERSHTRTVSKTVGIPLSHFSCTKELVQALMDAIQGHGTAFEAGIEHRDVSDGNVMLANGRGFLHDLDYAFNWKAFLYVNGFEDTMASWQEYVRTQHDSGVPAAGERPQTGSADDTLRDQRGRAECKERTGTFYFMAIAIIKTKDIIHDAHHDLESFYWLLVWLVLRHTKYKHYYGADALRLLFGAVTSLDAYINKHYWILDDDELTVEGNKPLSLLLENFRRLCKLNVTKVERMTHASVLKIFKEALARDDWPSDDKASPYKP